MGGIIVAAIIIVVLAFIIGTFGWLKGIGIIFAIIIELGLLIFLAIKTEQEQLEKRKMVSRQVREIAKKHSITLPSYEEYEKGRVCIGISPYCKGRKSSGAVACKQCYLSQGFDRPVVFAQNGGGASKGELQEIVFKRLGYYEDSPGLWRRPKTG